MASYSTSLVLAPARCKAVLSLEKASSMGERSGEYPGKKRGGGGYPSPLGDREETASPFAFRFCLAEKESLHIPQGLRDAQACGEQVETKPEWNQERHDESEAGNPTCEHWNPITLPVIGRRSIFAVEKQREVSQWNVTPAFKARFCVNRTLPS